MDVIRDLGPKSTDRRWRAAQALLAQGRAPIAHVDTGLAAHPALGFDAQGRPPANIRMDLGVNFHDPSAGQLRPWTTLEKGPGAVAQLTEYPDHGIKTLSVILADRSGQLRGVAPGAVVVPYRVANGPVFRYPARTACIGDAIEHAMGLPSPCRVVSISMGNPGFTGAYEWLRQALAGEIGMARRTREAIDAAYEAGVIVVCAAGQVIESVVYPARFARTIAVGGFGRRGALYDHYPVGGYDEAARVDVWAAAVGVNRAAAHLGPDGAPVWTFAETEGDEGGEASGTSYACPQVAAAAAMWVASHHDALEAAFGARGARWRIVEAFRRALRRSARAQKAQNGTPDGRPADIWALDVEALLAAAPDAGFDHRKRGKA